jgi:hypothetical protein
MLWLSFPTGVGLCTMAEFLYGLHSGFPQVERAHPDLDYSGLLPYDSSPNTSEE